MIEKKIRALADFQFKTPSGIQRLMKGEVIVRSFKNEDTLKAILRFGVIELVEDEVPEVQEEKLIPVILSKDSNILSDNKLLEQLQLTGFLDTLNDVLPNTDRS